MEYTPEHYFIAAISGCFFTTFSVVSYNSDFRYNSLKIKAVGQLGTSTGKKMMEKIEQDIELSIPSKVNERKAKRILEITEERCPLAKSVKTKIKNQFEISIE
ncbi:MAG: OsmC family protein [Promethearchaeia archaeon]